jgi:hypothetical protein
MLPERNFRDHRSISPNTMSMVPMMATASAIMCPGHLIQPGQMRKTRRTDLESIRLVRTIAHDVDAKLALGMLNCRIGFAFEARETLL